MLKVDEPKQEGDNAGDASARLQIPAAEKAFGSCQNRSKQLPNNSSPETFVSLESGAMRHAILLRRCVI